MIASNRKATFVARNASVEETNYYICMHSAYKKKSYTHFFASIQYTRVEIYGKIYHGTQSKRFFIAF